MPLCSICLNINFGTILQPRTEGYPEPTGGWPRNFELYFYDASDCRDTDFEKALVPHQDSLEKLVASARSCKLCRFIERCVSETLAKIKESNGLGFQRIPESNYTLWLSGRNEADGFQIIGCHNELRHQYRIMGGGGVCVSEDSPLARVVKGRPVSADPMFSSILAHFPDLIQDCKDKHGHVEYEKGEAPTRILRIEDNGQTITLVEGNMNIEGGYAALSHCWGDGPRITLNAGSVTNLTNGMNVADLPKTFQDTVRVVDRLGLSHLWIDSLCIFQDDPNDWARESARMAKVYGNSTVTIAASRATNSFEGFLGKRTQQDYIAAPFRHGQVSGEILIFPLHVRNVGDTSRYARLEDEPLTKRGWVLQERYLSPRTIHFDSSQVCFECKRTFMTEDGCSASPSRLNWQYKLPSHNSWEEDWEQVVCLYSQRKLTMKTDKLPAIAGIAEYFSNIAADASIDNRYLAGLWQNNIISGLCWQIDLRKGSQRRGGQYRAPTWSWASLDAAVWFRSVKHPLAVFQDAHVALDSDKSPFGKVTGGWILLRARKYHLMTSEDWWFAWRKRLRKPGEFRYLNLQLLPFNEHPMLAELDEHWGPLPPDAPSLSPDRKHPRSESPDEMEGLSLILPPDVKDGHTRGHVLRYTPKETKVASPFPATTSQDSQPAERDSGKHRENGAQHGCLRCRQRRVKYPEEKPSCAQCLTKGFKCSYNVQLRWQPIQEFKGTSLPVKQLVKDYMFLHASSLDFEDSTPTPFLHTSSTLTEPPDRSLDTTFSDHTICGDGITLDFQLWSSPIAISSVELDLWHYFSVAIAPACVLDPAVNPYKDIILRIAHPGDKTSPVFNIIMAIAAQEKAILGGPKYHSIAMRYYNGAVRTLRLDIIKLNNGLSDQASKASILATVMALVFLDIMSKCSNWWVVHSNFARSLVHKFRSIQPSYDPDQDALLNFVGGYVVIHEVYAHTAWDATEPDTYNEPITSMCDEMNLKTLTGCSTEFLQILADINSLAADF
ncbi:heterokaryon incompatibility protein [Fusarium pseudocircinatum]|uniref:Heterokaryon incompatibility protein n=1 Tax=Fusarium pseudocircinatum TaxID=56676 RepID=A0A8H5NUM2_9HYPO|nr:heterokaryon incompatibility protein [Fusarium pseudocircinatum]